MTLRSLRLILARLAIAAGAVSAVVPARGQIEMGGGRIEVEFEPGGSGLPEALILDWVKNAATAVTSYYGRFPVAELRVRVEAAEGDRIRSGRTFGSRRGGLIEVTVGRETTAEHFARDWMMTHEMVHLALPDLPERNHWLEEGIATYVEPIARARVGQLSAERVWADVVRDLPQGLPAVDDRGLDFTHTWGRTYWGGALFCLEADVAIRQRTGNAKGLIDALRGVLAAGGNITEEWDVARVLAAGDRATGVPVLQELYAQMSAAPSPVDLDSLWQKLGIERTGHGVAFTNDAPLSAVRRAIVPEK